MQMHFYLSTQLTLYYIWLSFTFLKKFLTHRIKSKLFKAVHKGLHKLISAVPAPYFFHFPPYFLPSSHNGFSESLTASFFLFLGCHLTHTRSSLYFQTWKCRIWVFDRSLMGYEIDLTQKAPTHHYLPTADTQAWPFLFFSFRTWPLAVLSAISTKLYWTLQQGDRSWL